MQFQSTMRFLGIQERQSKKSGNTYYLAKFMHEASSEIYEMYVPDSKLNLVTNIGKAEMFETVLCVFNVSGFNGKMQVDLHQIARKGEKVEKQSKDNSIKASI